MEGKLHTLVIRQQRYHPCSGRSTEPPRDLSLTTKASALTSVPGVITVMEVLGKCPLWYKTEAKVAIQIDRSEPHSTEEPIMYSPSSSEDVPEPKSLEIAASGSFDLSQMHHSHPHFANNFNGNTYPIGPQGNYSDPSAMLGLNHRHIEVANMDTDRSIHPGHSLIYPSPITPIGVSTLQEETRPEPNQQELHNYLRSTAEETSVHPFNRIGSSRTALR